MRWRFSEDEVGVEERHEADAWSDSSARRESMRKSRGSDACGTGLNKVWLLVTLAGALQRIVAWPLNWI
jgi:hypothetical protein